MLTMVLGGLWHGAAWTFVDLGRDPRRAGSSSSTRRRQRRARGLPELPDTVGRRWSAALVTFNIVCLAWVFFRADSFGRAGDVLAQLIDGAGGGPPPLSIGVGPARDRGRHRRPVRARTDFTAAARAVLAPPLPAQAACLGVAA